MQVVVKLSAVPVPLKMDISNIIGIVTFKALKCML
jgi:hypothetical protein